MSFNSQQQIKRATVDYEIALDNASLKRKKVSELQRELNTLNTNDNHKTDRLISAVDKARNLMDKMHIVLSKAQEKSDLAREQYLKLETEFQTEEKRARDKKDKSRRVLENKVNLETREEKSWNIKAENARRDLELLRRRSDSQKRQEQKKSQGNARSQVYR